MPTIPTITEEYQRIKIILSELKSDSELLKKICLSFPFDRPEVLSREDNKLLDNREKEVKVYSAKFGTFGLTAERIHKEIIIYFPSVRDRENHPLHRLLDINRYCLIIASLCKTGEIYRTSREVINNLDQLQKSLNSVLSSIQNL